MALNMKFADGSTYRYLKAIETEEFWNGSARRTLTFELARDAANLEQLDAACTEQNTARLELTNDDVTLTDAQGKEKRGSVTNIYEGYVLKLKLGVEPVLVETETGDTPASYEERIIVKLGKRTYIEEQLHKLGVL